MTQTEGVIQYQLDYRPGPLPPGLDLRPLFRWFARCRELELIGRDPARYDGFAYGNISLRAVRGFVISATQTGGRPALDPEHLAWVEAFDAQANRLRASGPRPPSSEAMTHGQVYRERRAVGAVIHVHSAAIWQRAQALGLPVTSAAAGYGTPAMAAEVHRLLAMPGAGAAGLFVMGGHVDGVVAYATDMDAAGECLLATLRRAGSLDR